MATQTKKYFLFVLFLLFGFYSYAQTRPGQAQEYLQAGIRAIAHYQYEDAIHHLDESIIISRKTKDHKSLEEGLQNRAYAYTRLARMDPAKLDYFELLNAAIAGSDRKNMAHMFIFLGITCRDNSQYDSCIYYGEKAMETSILVNDSSLIAKSNMVLGLGYFSKSIHNKANSYWLESLRIAENIHDSLTAAEVMSYLGLTNSELKNQQSALELLNAALQKLVRNKQYIEIGNCFLRMGVCYKRLKEYDTAIVYYKKAMLMGDSLNEVRLSSRAYHNLSDVYAFQFQFDSALYYNLKSIAAAKKINSVAGIIVSQNALAQLYRILGDERKDKSYFYKAIPLFEEDLALARKINLRDFVAKCYEELAYCYDGLKDYQKAYNHFIKSTSINDSIRSERTSNQVSDLQAKYDTEKKENEILKLNSEKLLDAEKIAREQTLSYSLMTIAGLILVSGGLIFRNVQKKRVAEKKIAVLEKQNAIENMRGKIASDVHDDVGASLTKLGLNAQQLMNSSNVQQNEKQLAEKINIQSKEIITGMREIIWASNPANDNLKSMLGFMRQYIDRFFDGTDIRPSINFPHQVGEIILHPEVRRNLFLILKESLNNAIKYSGTDKIDIDFTNENENFNFRIKDYGKGIDDKKKDDFGNGLNNMQMRAMQIQSLFKLVTAPGSGVQIMVEGKLY